MGSATAFGQSVPPDRTAALRDRVKSLVAMDRRFLRTVSVSNEIDAVLPSHGLPLGCVHELRSHGLTCGIAFASLLVGRVPAPDGQVVYIAPNGGFHPLGLLPYGVRPERWIHVRTRNAQDWAWTVLETLRCPQVSAVLAVAKAADLTLCRRWQLAAEGSGATGFLLTDTAAKSAIASVITRWQIAPMPAPAGAAFEEPCWALDLDYCRGGRPAQWTVAWRGGRLEPVAVAAGAPAVRPVRRGGFVAGNRRAV